MLDSAFSILKTKTIKDSAISFSGTFVTGILGAAFYILLARFLGPSNFGIFSVSILVLTLLADVSNIGTNTGIIKFVGKYFKVDPEKAFKFLKLGLKIKLTISFALVLVGFFLVPFVANYFFKKPEFILPLRISLIGVVGLMTFSFVTNAFDSMQKYLTSNTLAVATNAFRLFLIIGLFSLQSLSLNLALIVYVLVPLIGFLIGLRFLPNFIKVKNENEVSSEFLKFNLIVAVFTAIAAVSGRLDSFLATRYLSLSELGIYSVAVTLASGVPQIVLALGGVVAPKLSAINGDEEAFKYLKKLQIFVTGLSIFGVTFGVLISKFVIPYFYGESYLASIAPFSVLLISQAIFLFSIPVHTAVIYYFSNPKLFVYISTIYLLIILFFGWVLIPKFGMMGAAISSLVGNISNFIIPAFWVLRKFKKI